MFSNPQKNIKMFALGEGWHVADFGSGPGAYTFEAAEAVGPNGRVYAIDVQKELLSKIKDEALERKLSNVEIVWGDVEEAGGSKLGDNTMDAIIASNILFQAESKQGIAEEIKRVLKPKGRVLVVDWKDSFGGLGPRPDHVITEDLAKELFQNLGFEYEQNIDAGENHYGIIFKKKDS